MNYNAREQEFEKLTMANHFLFGEVLSDEETSKSILEIILGMEIEQVVLADKEKNFDNLPGYRSIRMDVYVRSSEDNVYNIEMQVEDKHDTPQRSRYYQGMMDTKQLPAGAKDYRELNKGYVIFICQFDPFGQQKCYYTFEERCIEDLSLSMGDGTRKIFLNTKGKNREDISAPLLEFLDYIQSPEKVALQDMRLKAVDERVKTLKRNAKVRERYMTLQNWIEEEADKAREEGHKEGLKKGLEEGLEQGKMQSLIHVIRNMNEMNMGAEKIEEVLKLTNESVQKILNLIIQYPEYSDEEIAKIYMNK